MKKNVSRKRFLVCFRPVVDMDLMLESKSVVKEDIVMKKASEMENSIVIHQPGKKTLSQVIKAVVFEIILAKKGRGRKVVDQGICSTEKHSFRLRTPDKLMGTCLSESVNRVSSISSCSSSSSKNSTQELKGQELGNNKSGFRQQRINRSSSSDSALFLLLASLAVTIFWGKFLAILFTSIWLYFLTQYQKHGNNPGKKFGKLQKERHPEQSRGIKVLT